MVAFTTPSSFSAFPAATTSMTEPRTLDLSRLVRGSLVACAMVVSTFTIALGIADLLHTIAPMVGAAFELWTHPMGFGVL